MEAIQFYAKARKQSKEIEMKEAREGCIVCFGEEQFIKTR
jgi:hypothetical protein